MPIETISAMILVVSTYLIFIYIIQLIRLGDRDSFSDTIRKRIYRSIRRKAHLDNQFDKILQHQDLTPEELEKILML